MFYKKSFTSQCLIGNEYCLLHEALLGETCFILQHTPSDQNESHFVLVNLLI